MAFGTKRLKLLGGGGTVLFASSSFLLAEASPRSCQSPSCSLGTINEQMEKLNIGRNPPKVPLPPGAFLETHPPQPPAPSQLLTGGDWLVVVVWKVGRWGKAYRASELETRVAELLHSWLLLSTHCVLAR